MTLVRYNPLNNFVPGTFGDFIESVLRDAPARKDIDFTPAVDILKEKDHVELQLVAPGMSKEDFKIDVDQNSLTIRGERVLSDEAKTKLQKRESNYGKFSRAFKLTDDINQEKITATYVEGILKVKLPLIEKKETKSIIEVK
ncbi:Heat shock protein Hsp20 [Fulvivirga imtechensis AK7]|uniref:Heat shock protein Hsp20 n=1 Tax=Fulvivirga imtechensis AK7 TaxID=1237149 RepID=L8JMQ2_9BACT|nr:Hsp20/alpha crystallin family protein [Fulvivirga imtechensis]ELR70110.1 Heat shock protein Hsp20 [Fulvivirga imtechensis AK7]